ncbi:DUF4185 domain-containing protein [Bacillus sp. IITD106]|nr:DUF4185 domain-containing protein [Bacillus sp. IITD106]
MNNIRTPNKVGDELPIHKVFRGRSNSSKMLLDKLDYYNDSDEIARSEKRYIEEKLWTIFDLGGTYPIKEMLVRHLSIDISISSTNRAIEDLTIEHSLDKQNWTALIVTDNFPHFTRKESNMAHEDNLSIKFNSVLARYIKISLKVNIEVGSPNEYSEWGNSLDFSKVKVYAGKGLAVEPASDWTDLFHRKEGWSGADGIYSIPFNGCERTGEAHKTKTIFVFGDTFIGSVDPVNNRRIASKMINNSIAILEGNEPKKDAIKFLWNTDEKDNPTSYFIPASEKGKNIEDSYYWLQDGISIKGTFHCFPMIISPDPTQPEGFEFKVNGVTCVSAPIGDEGPILEQQTQLDTPFYYKAANGKITYFGAGFMANTEEANVSKPDGYIYIYGLQKWETTKMVVARISPHQFTDFANWEFWDGASWNKEKEKAVPIAQEVSSELSVSYMDGGFLDGKYIVVFQEHGTGKRLGIYTGDSPEGPFEDPVYLYYCSESERGDSIYTYNAKGHPHLSDPGELLVSYNVNTSSWPMHEKDGSIYRPKFLKIKQFE